ncbi:flagellar hook-length control protein [mine drainage metagenome]|uniref:Flagellar hook-length control protein n=1 Tax=mine drainage metagenome TaxID=410659 RepID=A0A1J5PUC3_9ZZZZ
MQVRWRDAAALLLAPVAGETGTKSGFVFADALGQLGRPQEHKSTLAQAGTGFEGMLGSALSDKLGISATYEVAAASAVVPDSQVAETVTHWVTHGVQNAELTLDGLGSEPVQVRISLHGDQAQIDFRSNQADVRLALEGAGAQLKSMLSSEGLQLAGMSVGTSGKGSQQHEQRQPQTGIRQTTVLSVDALAGTTPRVGNRSVGQALDLYV